MFPQKTVLDSPAAPEVGPPGPGLSPELDIKVSTIELGTVGSGYAAH